jgi:hypothetical protein
LEADRFWFRQGTREILLEGGVRLQAPGITGHFDRCRLWLDDHRIGADTYLLYILSSGEDLPCSLRGKKLEMNKREGDPAIYTVDLGTAEGALCSFAVPHVAIRAMGTRLVIEDHAGDQDRKVLHTGPGTLRAGGWPLLPLPPMRKDLSKDSLLRSVDGGQSGKLGSYVRTDWGQVFKLRHDPWLGRWRLERLEWKVDADYYDTRGVGRGVGTAYRGPNFFGEGDYYFIQDEGRDEEFRKLREHDRWQGRGFHHHALSERWGIDLEYLQVSDPDFRNIYFKKEAVSGKPAENRAFLAWRGDRSALSFLSKARGNDFTEEVEHLPSARLEYFSVPVVESGLLYDSGMEIANLRDNHAERPDGDGQSFRSGRFDTEQTLSYPFFTGDLLLWEPFAGTRQTWYEEVPSDGHEDWRGMGIYGASVASRLERTWGAPGDQQRHVTLPRAFFRSQQDPTVPKERLPQFDPVDSLTGRDTLDLSLQNLFQTKEGEDPARTFLDHRWETTFFPNPHRDNPQPNSRGDRSDREFSDLRQEILWWPIRTLVFSSDMEYDWYGGVVDEASAGGTWRGSDWGADRDRTGRTFFSGDLDRGDGKGGSFGSGFALGVEHRYRREASSLTVGRVEIPAGEKWRLRLEGEHEWEKKEGILDRRVVLVRDCHDFVLEIGYEEDASGRESIFFFNLTPHGLGRSLGTKVRAAGTSP